MQKENGLSKENFSSKPIMEWPELLVLYSGPVKTFFVEPSKDSIVCRVFSSQVNAEQAREELAKEGYNTRIEVVRGEQGKLVLFEQMAEMGIDTLKIDNDKMVDLFRFVADPGYDGFVDYDKPLRNTNLNATLHYFYEELHAKRGNLELEKYLFELLLGAKFIVPIYAPDEMFVTMENEHKQTMLTVFTDWASFEAFMGVWKENMGLEVRDKYAGYICDFETIHNIIKVQPEVKAVIAPSTAQMTLALQDFAGVSAHYFVPKSAQEGAVRQQGGRFNILGEEQ